MLDYWFYEYKNISLEKSIPAGDIPTLKHNINVIILSFSHMTRIMFIDFIKHLNLLNLLYLKCDDIIIESKLSMSDRTEA